MKITTQIKISSTKEQFQLIKSSLQKYIFAVNNTVSTFVEVDAI